MGDRKIVEQSAKEMPDMKDVKLRMVNLCLHASGVFSNVYRGTLLFSNGQTKNIAIKKTWPESRDRNFEMIFLTGVSRERHKNIVQMLYAFSNRTRDDRICESFVFDFMPDTMASVLKKTALDMVDIKMYTFQLFTGLKYLAQENIVHRDIKPVNILVDHATGLLKIGDFGSAKIVQSNQASTSYQVTRFYRPPELLLGSTHYSWTVDLWSAGCVVGEMLRRQVLFAGRDAKHQLRLIFSTLGLPTDSDIRSMRVPTRLDAIPVDRVMGQGLLALMPLPQEQQSQHQTAQLVALLGRILIYRPKQRLCGTELLRDHFFDSMLAPGVRRANGKLVSGVLSTEDVRAALSDKGKTSRLSQLMSKKVDFVFGPADEKKQKQKSKEPQQKTALSHSLSDEQEQKPPPERRSKMESRLEKPSTEPRSHISPAATEEKKKGSSLITSKLNSLVKKAAA